MSDKKSGASEAMMGWGIMLGLMGALGYFFWWHFHEQIRSVIRWVRYGEMALLSPFLPKDYTIDWEGQPVKFHEVMRIARSISSEKIDNDFLALLSTVTLTPYLIIIVPVTIAFAFWALFKGPGSEHRQSFDIDSLIKKQSSSFPIIAPFVNFNPSKLPTRAPGAPVPAELPLFSEALGPEEWVVYNEIPLVDKALDEEATTKAFAKQLGPRWRGAKHLEPYQQILLAAFCLKAARKRADSDNMMGRLAHCWKGDAGLKIDKALIREARSVLANGKIASSVLKKCNEHAWVTTALMRGLATAREEGGVLAPAQFVWLRAHERSLWYPLNNMGRQSLHMEAIGAMAHYKAEKLSRRPIPRPKVADAVKSIINYMTSKRVRVLPQLDYSGSTKSGIKKLKNA